LPTKKIIYIIIAAQLLAFHTAHADETELVIVPDSISDIYSDVDMRVRLAAKPNAAPCVAQACETQQEFDARVQQLGAQLSVSAHSLYPTLKKRVPQFAFSVVDKKEPGTASNGAGKVVLFRGLQHYELTDDALSFIIAREMGHVIGKHHTKNTSTKLIISALASIAFPALAVLGASSAAAQATTATTLLTSAASTATSMLGSEVALAKIKPSQLVESDEIALKLLNNQDWDLHSTASILQLDDFSQNSWTQDLKTSNAQLQKVAEAENIAVLPLEDDYILAEAEPIEAEPAVKIGLTIENVDSTSDEEDLPLIESMVEADIDSSASTSTDADVSVGAISK
jgi:predicted Zn-dependent protease